MLKNLTWTACLAVLLLAGCRQPKPEEKDVAAYWDPRVVAPSHELMYKTSRLEPALALYDSLYNVIEGSSPYVEASRYVMISNYHLFLTKNNEKTLLYIDSALGVYKSIEEQFPRAYVGLMIYGGEIAFRLGNYSKSNNYFFIAKQFSDKFLDPCERSGFTYNVAMVSYRQQNYAKSAAYFKEAYAAQATCPVQTTAIILQQQEIQGNIGLCLVKLKQYDSAIVHFNNALQIADRYKDSLGPVTVDKIRGVVYGNMAKIFVAKGDLKEAEALYKKSIALNARPGYEIRDAMLAQVQLAEVYSSQQRLPEMYSQLLQVQQGLDTIPDNDARMGWMRLMAKYYRETGSPLQELQYLKDYGALRDSVVEAQKQLLAADITRQLRDKEQVLRIDVLTRDNELNQLYLWLAASISGMAAIIIFLVYQNYRRSKKNIAALTKLNEQISEQKLALEIANKEKDRILHVVAHDLRNPIGLTAYVSELILMEERNEKDAASLQMIREASSQALAMTDALLGLKQAGENSTTETIELHALAQNAIQLLQYKAAEKGQSIQIRDAGKNLFVKGDPGKLNRVVNNLLDNAIKFSHTEGHIRVGVEEEGTNAVLTVADEGIGVPEDKVSSIFDHFTPYRRKGTHGEKSFGLGLSICRDFVEEQGGTIAMKSAEGKGTVFYVRLPLAQNA